MASHELGGPAYRKYDIEAWLTVPKFWGEVSWMNYFVLMAYLHGIHNEIKHLDVFSCLLGI